MIAESYIIHTARDGGHFVTDMSGRYCRDHGVAPSVLIAGSLDDCLAYVRLALTTEGRSSAPTRAGEQ